MTLKLTGRYAASVAKEHRQKFGQFFTPEAVAEFMCRWAMDGNGEEVFDPAFGLGAFYREGAKRESRRCLFLMRDR